MSADAIFLYGAMFSAYMMYIVLYMKTVTIVYENLCARSRYRGQGQVITSHIYYGM